MGLLAYLDIFCDEERDEIEDKILMALHEGQIGKFVVSTEGYQLNIIRGVFAILIFYASASFPYFLLKFPIFSIIPFQIPPLPQFNGKYRESPLFFHSWCSSHSFGLFNPFASSFSSAQGFQNRFYSTKGVSFGIPSTSSISDFLLHRSSLLLFPKYRRKSASRLPQIVGNFQ